MLGLFSKKSDHPLADPREAVKICAGIAAADPQAAIDEVEAWLESVAAADDLKLSIRIERIVQLDEVATAQVRRLGRDYLSHWQRNQSLENKLWTICRGYWRHLISACEASLDRFEAGDKESAAAMPLRWALVARLVSAQAALLKWEQFRYGPLNNELWRTVGKLYLEADAASQSRSPVVLYPGHGSSSIEAEYLKTLLFQASAMDSLLPVEIELAERLIVHFLPKFALTRDVRPESVYWVDAAQPMPPSRLAKLPELAPTLRFFSGVAALSAVAQLRERIEAEKSIPADIILGGQYDAKVVGEVLAHLASCWAPKPPMRKDARHRIKSRLDVAHGIEDAHGRISGSLTSQSGIEVWSVDDVSLGGMAAQVQLSHKDWIRLGVLVALRPDGGGNWLLGRIRRFSRTTTSQGVVGIETLTKTPLALTVDVEGLPTNVILLDLPEAGGEVRVVLPAAAIEDDLSLSIAVSHDGKNGRFYWRETLITGFDFCIARFFVASYA